MPSRGPGRCSRGDDLDLGANGTRLLEQGFRLVWIVLQAADALQVPGVALGVGLVGHGALPVIHRVMDGLAVDGVRRRNAQALVLKHRALPVEDQKAAAGMPLPDVVFRALSPLKRSISAWAMALMSCTWPVRSAVRRTESSRLGLPMISSR